MKTTASGQERASNQEPIKQTSSEQPEQKASPSKDDLETIFWSTHSGNPPTYRAICEKPTDNTQADLCQQWRAANAAEKAAKWAFPQFIASVAGVIGLVVTIAYSIKATNAAVRTAEIAEQSLVALERSFVYLKEVQAFSHLNVTTNKIFWSFHPIWENSGRTPTRNLRFFSARYLEDNPMPMDYKFDSGGVANTPTLLGPGASAGGDAVFITGEDVARVQRGEMHAYIWGWTRYNDLFKGTEEHVTRFCYNISCFGDPEQRVSTDNVVQFNYAHFARHNCADEECDRQDHDLTSPL